MSEHGPILFLDIDDVLCMQNPYGRIHVRGIFKGYTHDAARIYAELFSPTSKAALAQVSAALEGRVRYVVSSLWKLAFDRAAMLTIFHSAGLPFVAERLEPGVAWCTPVLSAPGRDVEIAHWLRRHHRGEPYAIVDDTGSGYGLIEAARRSGPEFVDRVVICEEEVGLLDTHVPALVAALQRPGVAR